MKQKERVPVLSSKLHHLLRTVGNRREKPVALILCEGEATEPNYFQGLVQHWRLANVVVRAAKGSDPTTIVRDAIDTKHKREKEAAQSNAFVVYDEVWCVFDVDQHPHLKQAISIATKNGISVAISNPCFEFWLVLHYERFAQTNLTRHQMQSRLKKHIAAYKKGNDYCKCLLPLLPTAISNAENISRSQWNIAEPTASNVLACNPSTRVHQLIQSIDPS